MAAIKERGHIIVFVILIYIHIYVSVDLMRMRTPFRLSRLPALCFANLSEGCKSPAGRGAGVREQGESEDSAGVKP